MFGLLHLNGDVDRNQVRKLIESIDDSSSEKKDDSDVFFMTYSKGEGRINNNEYFSDKNFHVVSDAILYNREYLLSQLNLASSVSNSHIFLKAYELWGEMCVDHLEGDFVFFIFDVLRKTVVGIRDHVGKKLAYYFFDGKCFICSSSISAILTYLNEKPKLNDLWIKDFFLDSGPSNSFDGSQTIYENVFQLKATSITKLMESRLSSKRYWDPLKSNRKIKSFESASNALMEVFSKAVSQRTDQSLSNGIFLSGGLDSGAVAGFASRHLKKTSSQLIGICGAPLKSFNRFVGEHYVTDESENMMEIVSFCENITPHVERCEGKDCLSEIDHLLRCYEQPYKSIENAYWFYHLAKRAEALGCEVILTGQYGNSSISFGEMFAYSEDLYSRKKWLKFLSEIFWFSRVSDQGLYKYLKFILKHNLSDEWLEKLTKSKIKEIDEINYLNPDYFKEKGDGSIERPAPKTLNDYRVLNTSEKVFAQINNFYCHLERELGISFRDPTMDKQVISICNDIPDHFFCNHGKTRKLVRSITKGLIPDTVRLNYKTRGFQGVDWIYRIEDNPNRLIDAVEELISCGALNPYLSIDVIQEDLNKVKELGITNATYDSVKKLIKVIIFGKFTKIYNKERGKEGIL